MVQSCPAERVLTAPRTLRTSYHQTAALTPTPTMSSLRNAVKRVEHKERAQPASRRKLGLLEKHKDYVLRARNYGKKRDRMQALKLKAAMKNPDEFYFAMHRKKTEGGVHMLDGAETLPHDVVQMLKTQDLGYVSTHRSADERKAAKLRESLHMLEAGPRNKHTIFLDSEKEAKEFDVAKHFDTVPELADRAFNRPRKNTLEKAQVTGATNRRQLKKVLKKRDASYSELMQRLERAEKMKKAEVHLEAQRKVMNSKGTKRKVQEAKDGRPAVYRWKKERSR
ncbi:unnamed protein product [Ectocarpus sp. 12 AP-2014]